MLRYAYNSLYYNGRYTNNKIFLMLYDLSKKNIILYENWVSLKSGESGMRFSPALATKKKKERRLMGKTFLFPPSSEFIRQTIHTFS